VLVGVMFCLTAVLLIATVVLRLSFTEHRVRRSAEWKLQAEWLAESAVERAVSRLAKSQSYAGDSS
jgi:type II secretory pathway component PulK